MFPPLLRISLAALCACAVAACSPARYAPRALDVDALAGEYAGRTTGEPALAQFAAQSGYEQPWPPGQWRLAELTLVALYFGPEVRTAQAQAEVARAEIAVAGAGAPFSVVPAVEHHSRDVADEGPWSLGVAIGLPWISRAKREALVERAVALSDATELEVARAIWRARAQVRDRLIELIDARERLTVLESALAARRDMRGLVARRVEAGLLSARELSQEEVALTEVETALAAQRGQLREARAAMAHSLGLAPQTFDRMTLAPDAVPRSVDAPGPDELREAALRNRLDIHQHLLAFEAADAQVKLAVASQYPDLTFSPGYLWDQGDSVWSLATSIAYPPGLRSKAALREAEARRELAAQRVFELQSQIIGEAQQATERLASARNLSATASAQADAGRARLARVENLFARGTADRLELTAARLAATASAEIERQASTATLRALAGLEDVMQKPLLDSGQGLRTVTGAR